MIDAARITVILLAAILCSGMACAAETTPVYPGMGGAPVEVLTNMHPMVKQNTVIMGYIWECGVGIWHEEQRGADFKSVHLSPANSCGKQLVFSLRKSGERDDATRITGIWIIGANETWSSSMDTIYPGGGISRVPAQMAETPNIPSFYVAGVVIVLALIGIVFALIERKKKSS